MPYAKDHKERTRKRILESARRLFAARGFGATSIDDVMLECGLTRGGFYAHFRSKAQLYREAMSVDTPAGNLAVPLAAQDSAGWLDAVFASCLQSFDMIERGASDWAFLALDVASRQPDVRASYADAFKGMSQRLHREMAHSSQDDRTALAATAMIVGALAVATTVDEESLKTSLVDACREQAKALLGNRDDNGEPSFFWAADSSRSRHDLPAPWAVH
jgi:TetR/AcrR family transcriptional repressor of nem operon